jgi:tripartite-type tricarboxylate transporter receptor subunit TctC
VHVPLRGTPQILVEVMSGRVQLAAVPVTSGLGPIRDKKVVALAVSTRERSSILPAVPTSSEAGFPAAEFNFWFGMLAPAATPRPIINQLNAEIARIMATPEMKDRLEKLGTEPFVLTPERFDAFLADEARTLQAVMRSVGAKGE